MQRAQSSCAPTSGFQVQHRGHFFPLASDTFGAAVPSSTTTPLTMNSSASSPAYRRSSSSVGPVALTVTSPPYAGVYDYVAHHEARLRWLGMDDRGFRSREIGARKRLSDVQPDEGRAAWSDELSAVLRSLHRVTKPLGLAVLPWALPLDAMSPASLDGANLERARVLRGGA